MLKKINFGYAALILGLSLTLVTSAFKASDKSRANQIWHFQGTAVSQAADETKYSLTLPPPTECGSGTELPCYLETPEAVDTQAELDAYIMTNFSDNPNAVNSSITVRRAD